MSNLITTLLIILFGSLAILQPLLDINRLTGDLLLWYKMYINSNERTYIILIKKFKKVDE